MLSPRIPLSSILLFSLCSGSFAADNVDVTAAWKSTCYSYCGQGNVDNCDIGNGNLALAIKSHPYGVNRTQKLTGSVSESCNEQEGNTCIGDSWCDFNSYHCLSHFMKASGTAYSNIQSVVDPEEAGFVFTHWIDNDSSQTQSTTIEFDESTSATASISLTTTVSIGMSYSISAGVPDIMQETFTEDIKVETSSTSSNSETTTQEWKLTQPVIAKPRTTMKAQLVIKKVSVSGDWTALVTFPEDAFAKLWCHNKVEDHNEWFFNAVDFLPQIYPHSCTGNSCKVIGRFNGWHGVSSAVTLKECPLYSRNC